MLEDDNTQRGCFLVVSSSGQVLVIESFSKKSKTLLGIKLLKTLLAGTPFVCLFENPSWLGAMYAIFRR